MHSYMHTNSSNPPPTMTGDALAIYRAIRAGTPIVIAPGHYTPDALAIVAERLRCDEGAAALASLGVDAWIIDRPVGDTEYVEAAVHVATEPRGSVDGEAAARIVARIRSGLAASDAIARTLTQCDRPVLSRGAIDRMNRDADAAQRRINRPHP